MRSVLTVLFVAAAALCFAGEAAAKNATAQCPGGRCPVAELSRETCGCNCPECRCTTRGDIAERKAGPVRKLAAARPLRKAAKAAARPLRAARQAIRLPLRAVGRVFGRCRGCR